MHTVTRQQATERLPLAVLYAKERGYEVIGGYGPNMTTCIAEAVDFAESTPGTGDAFAQDTPYRRRHSGARIRRIRQED